MYTHCTIQWLDDLSEMDVIIKAFDELDEYDDRIFFYGLSSDFIQRAMETGEVCEGEWRIIEIHETFNQLQ